MPPRVRSVIALVGTLLAATAADVRAQQPVRDVLSFLLTNRSVPTDDFERDAEAAESTRDTISALLQVELSTLPISSSSAGFTYRLNPLLGTVERASDSFGPFFTERTLTAGEGQASIGVAVEVARFTRLDGLDLRAGTLVTTGNRFRDEAEPFDVETLTLDLETRTVSLLANVGVTDRLDIGAAVPLVFLSFEGQRVNTYRGQSLLQARASAEASGLGDVALRAKYRLLGETGTGLAAAGELRLPTGRAEDLLGTGETAFKGMVIASTEPGRVAASANFGMTFGGLSDELHYSGALTVSASPQLTLVGELVGRRIGDVGHIVAAYAPHPTIDGVDTLRLVTDGTSTHTSYAVAGFKWNVQGSWLVSGNVLLPLTDSGLRADVVPVFAVDYAFGR